MTARPQFDAHWPALARRLDARLARRNVPAPMRDDVVQETGLRLLEMWPRVDPERPVWPLVVTIAGNLLWDDVNRRRGREVAMPIEDRAAPHDVEDAAIARTELTTVSRAMRQLTQGQRDALLAEVGASDIAGRVSPDALKMLRMRARRRLALLLRGAPAPSVLWLRSKAFLAELARAPETPAALAGVAIYATILLAPSPIGGPAPDQAPGPRALRDPGALVTLEPRAAQARRPGPAAAGTETAVGERDRRREIEAGLRGSRPERVAAATPAGESPLPPPRGAHNEGRVGRTGPGSARWSTTVWLRGEPQGGQTACVAPKGGERRSTYSCEVHAGKARARLQVRIRR